MDLITILIIALLIYLAGVITGAVGLIFLLCWAIDFPPAITPDSLPATLLAD